MEMATICMPAAPAQTSSSCLVGVVERAPC
jgi:hypothetical protein